MNDYFIIHNYKNMNKQKQPMNWFLKTGLMALGFLTAFTAITYPIYRAQKRKLEKEDAQV